MNKPAAFKATYSDLKLIKTRQCVQIIFELPLADFDEAYDVLGGMPNPAQERWFAVAAIALTGREAMPNSEPSTGLHNAQPQPDIQPRPAGAKPDKRDWKDVQPAQQAGIRCSERSFDKFLRDHYFLQWDASSNAAECVRNICGVNSRVELGTNQKARVIWHQLDSEYSAWLLKEQVGA